MKTLKELCNEYSNIKVLDSYDIEKTYRSNTSENIDEAYNQKIAAYAENDKRKMERIIIRHNAKVVFFEEYLPKVLDAYNKYAGKRVGEKTKDKIRTEINELLDGLNVNVYINNDGVNYSVLNSSWDILYFRYDTEYKKRLGMRNEEGKLNKLDVSMLNPKDIKYIDNSEEYIAAKKAQAEKIRELSNELEMARNIYNENLCEGINRMEYGKTDGYFRVRI